MRSWTRTILFAVFTAAFLGLATSILVLDGPWYLSLAYVGCAAATAGLAYRARPADAARRTPSSAAPDPAEQVRRARRSGNPAVRAEADRRDASH